MKINIIKHSKVSLAISAGIMLLGLIVAIVCGGLNLGVDFTGGSLVTLAFEEEYKTEDVEAVLKANNAGEVSIVKSEDNQAIIRIESKSEEELIKLNDSLVEGLRADKGYKNAKLVGVDTVGATASRDLIINALLSVSLACVLILIYVWIRFELFAGISAVLALIHDVLIMLAFVAIFRIPVNSTFIAAVLTIVGYSINSTILVFDRLRENKKLYRNSMKDADLINKSVGDTFWRSVNTSLTTLIEVVALFIFGVDSIREFTLPILVGLLAGAFSSIVLSGQWWYYMKNKIANK